MKNLRISRLITCLRKMVHSVVTRNMHQVRTAVLCRHQHGRPRHHHGDNSHHPKGCSCGCMHKAVYVSVCGGVRASYCGLCVLLVILIFLGERGNSRNLRAVDVSNAHYRNTRRLLVPPSRSPSSPPPDFGSKFPRSPDTNYTMCISPRM